jgi:hypothetical protein
VGDGLWWVLAAVVLLAVGVGVWMLRGKRERSVAPAAPEPLPELPEAAAPLAATPVAEATLPPVAPAAVEPPPAPPVAPAPPPPLPSPPRMASPPPPAPVPAALPRPAPAPVPRAAPEGTVTATLPKTARFELRTGAATVLVVERADAGAWADAGEAASTPVQREQLTGLLAHAAQLDGAATPADAFYAVHVGAGRALGLARGLAGSEADGMEAVPPGSFDLQQAATFAAVLLALDANRASLPALRADVAQTKTLAAALHPKLVAQTEGRLKTLVQDLARYLREAEENYAGAMRKPVFIERVADACRQAASLWAGTQAAAAAAREQLQAQAQASHFGEVQLEKSLAALRELGGQRRVHDVAARLLAGWERLKLVLGDPDVQATAALASARAALLAAIAADQALAASLGQRIDAAKVPDYVGKSEFIANRSAARELLAAMAGETLAPAAAVLDMSATLLSEGPPGREAQALLVQLDAQGRVIEARTPRAAGVSTSPAAG